MQLTYLIAWLLASPAWVCGETIGHVTRDYFGDIFSLKDCEPGVSDESGRKAACDESGRKAAQIPGEICRCQCAPSHYTFREDMKQCIKDVGECPVAMFVRPFAIERIPLVFLPMTGQLVYPGAHLTVSGITRLASKHLSCNVKASLLMTSHGWQPIRTPSQIFGVYYDGNKTFLQWLGDDEDRRRLQHHLVLIRLLCEGESSNGTFEPCAALRIGWAPGLETEFIDPSTNKNNFIIIGLCLGVLGLIYVGAVLIFLKVRGKNRRQLNTRQGLTPSHNTIESGEEDSNCTQLRNAYINNLVQEAEFTTKGSPKGSSTHRPTSDRNNGSSEGNHQSETSMTQDNTHITNGKKSSHYENYSRNSADIPGGDDLPIITSTQPPPQEFFVRIRGMISAAKNRLNSFRYRPTLLVIPEDDYFYQDFKERDMEGSGNRKATFKKFNGKTTNSPITSKMESIHGSNLGAAMLEAKLAPPLPPPRNAKPKSKKRAPSPPGERISTPDYSRETPSPVSLKDFSNSMERKNRRITGGAVSSENYSKFDLFRLDLYEKINKMRESGSTENEIAILEMNGELNRMKEDICDAESPSHHKTNDRNGKESSCGNLEYPPGNEDIKISRRQLLYKLEAAANMNVSDDEENDVELKAKAEYNRTNRASNRSMKEDYELDDDGVPSQGAGSVIEDSVINEASITCSSRPGTAMSNSSARTTSSQPSTMKEKLLIRRNSHPLTERDDLSECSETSEASLSGDSLNSSFRKQVSSPSLLESRRSLKSTEDLSMISGSSVITSSTAIKEIEGYDEDDDDDDEDHDIDEDDMTDITTQDDDSRFSTDLDAEIYSLDDSEHPSLEEYLQLSSQVAKKLSERTVPAFSNDSPREKNVISQFMKEFKTTIGRLKTAEDSKLRSMRTTSPGADNWTLRREEKRAKVARRVSIFKRNPLKGRKNEEPLVTEDNGKSYYDVNLVSETDHDAASSRSSTASSLSGPKRSKYKSKTPEIVPSAKVVDFTGDKTIISITNDTKASNGLVEKRENREYTSSPTTKASMPRVGKAVTPPLPPPKPHLDHLKMKIGTSHPVRTVQHEPTIKYETNSLIMTTDNGMPNENHKAASTLKNTLKKRKGPERYIRTPSIESDSISVANSDMTEDSLNTPVPERASEEYNPEDVSEDENSPIDRCLAQLADSVIQPTDDCSLNRYLSQLGTVLAAREDCPLDQCLNKLASNMNGNPSRATKGFNLSHHLPLCTWEHICADRGSDRSTPTSDRSSTTSRGSKGSQENLRKKTLNKAKHHHHHHRSVECKYNNGEVTQINNSLGNLIHQANGHVHTNRNDEFTAHVLTERAAFKSLLRSKNQIASTSEEDECGRASSLGSTRELETPISETTSDPGSADLERPRKKRPLLRRSKKGLNGTCRQHIQNSKFNKKDNGSLKKGNFQPRNSNTPRSSSSDVTVIQLEGNSNDHVTNVESSNTFVTLINVDSSDCSNSAEEK